MQMEVVVERATLGGDTIPRGAQGVGIKGGRSGSGVSKHTGFDNLSKICIC